MKDEEPDDAPPRPLRLGAGFWTAVIFGLVCVVAGYAFARWAPTLLTLHR
jgi:hypothetical protein